MGKNNTHLTYIQQLFDLLNTELFEGTLPKVAFTIFHEWHTCDAMDGYFLAEAYGPMHEIGLQYQIYISGTTKEIITVLAHEMVHLWDYVSNGEIGNDTQDYHRQTWKMKMKDIGLVPVWDHKLNKPTGLDRLMKKSKLYTIIQRINKVDTNGLSN